MKLAGAAAERFVAKSDPKVKAVLLHGPDAGLVRERMNAITKAIAGAVDDPFKVIEFPASALRDDPAKLADEAAALSLVGGRRVVRVRDADGDGRLVTTVLNIFKSFFANPVGDALVVLTAGELGSRAALVRAFEGADDGAAIACYADDQRTLESMIRDMLKAAGMSATPDALAYLSDHLGGDREVSRREIEKLILYMGAPGQIGEDDAMACVGDTAALAMDDLVFAAGDGDQTTVQRVYGRMMQEGVSPIMILNAAARHLLRLHETVGRVDAGKSIDQAVAGLKPPPFFKVAPRFKQQAQRWNMTLVNRALELLTEAELQSKSTDMPAPAIVERALMQVAQAARSAMRGR